MKIFLLNFIYLKNGMFATWSYKDSNGDEPIGSKTDIRNWEFSRERWYLRMHLVHRFFYVIQALARNLSDKFNKI